MPTHAVIVCRLRDAGRGWGHVFWLLVPIAGLVVLAILLSQPPKQPAIVGWTEREVERDRDAARYAGAYLAAMMPES